VGEEPAGEVSYDDPHQQPEEGLEVVPFLPVRITLDSYGKIKKSTLTAVSNRSIT
jgi:hypothetical protein